MLVLIFHGISSIRFYFQPFFTYNVCLIDIIYLYLTVLGTAFLLGYLFIYNIMLINYNYFFSYLLYQQIYSYIISVLLNRIFETTKFNLFFYAFCSDLVTDLEIVTCILIIKTILSNH